MPQILCLLAALQVLENIIKLHHAHGSQAEGASGAADGIHKIIVVSWSEVDQPVMDVLDGNRKKAFRYFAHHLHAGEKPFWQDSSFSSDTSHDSAAPGEVPGFRGTDRGQLKKQARATASICRCSLHCEHQTAA